MKRFKKTICLLLTAAICLCACCTGVSAKSEDAYTAVFSIVTDKTAARAGDIISVDVKLKTNYPIYAMSVPVIYDSTVFELQGTSNTDLKSFLTFGKALSGHYATNANWKSPDALYKRNANNSYWNSAAVKSKYKLVYAYWTPDSSISTKAVTLSSLQTIASFKLKVKTALKGKAAGQIFMNSDWIKTKACPGGLLAVGRSVKDTINTAAAGHVDYGQTINLTDAACSIPINGTNTSFFITSGGRDAGQQVLQKIKWYAIYRRHPLQLGISSSSKNITTTWSSDNPKIKVDENGLVTCKGWISHSAAITAKAYDANGILVGSDTVRVVFYKYDWQI